MKSKKKIERKKRGGSSRVAHGSAFYPLFEHMSREHGLTLTDSELYEILHIGERIYRPLDAEKLRRHIRRMQRANEIGTVRAIARIALTPNDQAQRPGAKT